MCNALISIIIPAYNTEKYIRRAIESSIRQTHKNTEIIIIDDGSTDDTLKVAQSYAEKNNNVKVFHQENAGVSSARNHGIREAKGEYFIFLDSDNWLEDNAAEFLLDAQIKNPDKLITTGKFLAKTKEDGKIYRTRRKAKMTPQIIDGFEKAILIWGNADLQATHYKIFRVDVIRKNNIFFRENIYNNEDGLFVFEYLHKMNGLVYIDKALWNILRRPSSATRSGYSRKMLLSAIEAKAIMINYPKNSPALKEFCIVLQANHMLYSMQNMIEKKFPKNEKYFLRKYLQKYAHDFLSLNSITFRRKLSYVLMAFFPSWVWLTAHRIKGTLYRIIFGPQVPDTETEYNELAADWLQ